MAATPSLDHLRRHALARSLAAPGSLPQAIERLAFVQADPIRAPARAQDLVLRQRVKGYRAGDLEARYERLPVEEDFFVNYGFLPHRIHDLMHPREGYRPWPKARWTQAHEVLGFVQDRGVVHPREVDAAFQHGNSKNWFGGNSKASTQLLDGLHYRGLLRVAKREGGTRLYALPRPRSAAPDPDAALDALVDVIVGQYAPLPQRTLSELTSRLLYAAPQWAARRRAAFARARDRLPHATVDGTTWYWPAGEDPFARRAPVADRVRLLAPFDPVVWDRRRFEQFWGWAYRFEAYTPAPKRVRGYYALPLLWRDQVIGWGNLAVQGGRLQAQLGYVGGPAPRDSAFRHALDAELAAMATFLGVAP